MASSIIKWIEYKINSKTVFPVLDAIRNKKFDRYIVQGNNSLINSEERPQKIIVSLTTTPGRLNYIHKTLESLCRQTIKPDIVVLNLGEEQFKEVKFPEFLRYYLDKGLNIKYVKDIGPHTKYYYTLQEYQNDLVITVDDDILYDSMMIERLIKLHTMFPDAVCANRCHIVTFDHQGKIKPYNKWIAEGYLGKNPSLLYLATGVGGVLYPPRCMDEDLFNEELIRKLSLYADDIWLKWMQLKKGTMVVTNRMWIKHLSTSDNTQKLALSSANVTNSRNDEYIKNICDYYSFDETLFKNVHN